MLQHASSLSQLATLTGLNASALAQGPMRPEGATINAAAATIDEVTVRDEQDIGYAPATTSTALKGSAPLRDVPQAVNVVPQQLLRDQGAISMQDALRNVPSVAFSDGDGQRDQVVIRGFTTIADWFVDGVRDDALYCRDLSDTERIEVLKGPAAVLFGWPGQPRHQEAEVRACVRRGVAGRR